MYEKQSLDFNEVKLYFRNWCPKKGEKNYVFITDAILTNSFYADKDYNCTTYNVHTSVLVLGRLFSIDAWLRVSVYILNRRLVAF